jgi:PAS domain S-box-containing protein
MSPKEDINSFNQHLFAVRQSSDALYKSAGGYFQQHEQVVRHLDDLRSALQELQISEAELRQQNEQLVVTRQALEDERQRYLNLFEFAPDGYIVTDIQGTVQEANRSAARLLNIPQQHLLGKPLINFVPEDQQQSFRALLNQLPKINRIQEWDIQLCRHEKPPFDVALTVETMRDGREQAIAFHWLLRDVTNRKRAEAQLRLTQLQNLELKELDRLKSQFISTLSHELRTPLSAILGFSQLLLRRFQRQQDRQITDMLERVFRNGKQLLALIEDLLNYSQLHGNNLELRTEPIDLIQLVCITVDGMRSLADQKGLSLQVHIPPNEILIDNDPYRLDQVLSNLLSNAIKFTAVGCISIHLWELPEGRVAITVSDTGIGINPVDQHRIFKPFWQVNQGTTREFGGTGLGLAISKTIVEQMQGSISVESQPGEGTTFRVELPRSLEPAQWK